MQNFRTPERVPMAHHIRNNSSDSPHEISSDSPHDTDFQWLATWDISSDSPHQIKSSSDSPHETEFQWLVTTWDKSSSNSPCAEEAWTLGSQRQSWRKPLGTGRSVTGAQQCAGRSGPALAASPADRCTPGHSACNTTSYTEHIRTVLLWYCNFFL